MRLGPLRFLACVTAGTMAWAVSRVPVVIARAEADVVAADTWQAERRGKRVAQVRLLTAPATREPESDAGVAAMPARQATPPLVRHSGVPEGGVAQHRNPAAIQARISAPFTQLPPLRQADNTKHQAAAASPIWSAAVPSLPPSGEKAAIVALVPPTTPRSPRAFDLAAAAYTDLARRDRRAAAREFGVALATDPAASNAAAWRAELRRLRQRWSGDAYILVRGKGPTGLGVAPLLGGGQSGGALAFTPDPLARRPVAVVARVAVAHEGAGFGIAGVDRGSLQTALGIRWQVMPGASLTAERLVAAGSAARDAWVLRAAGGAARKVGPAQFDAYAEAGIVGARRRDTFASAQARATLALPAGLDAGGGAWASVQDAATTVHRVDIGPTIGWRFGPLAARADWRFRVAGDAAPGSGPALTLSAAF